MIFKKRKNEIFGLDVSDLSIRLVQFRRAGDKTKVQAIGKYNLKKDVVVNGLIKDQEKLAEAIREAIKKPSFGSFTTHKVVASLPDNESFIKLIQVDKGPNPLTDTVEQEIEKYFPMSLDEIYFDYQVISQDNETISVLVGCCPKKIVDSYISCFQEAGLTVSAFETESAALARSLLPDESPRFKGEHDSAYAIIDIGGTSTSMIIYAAGSIVSSIALPISGQEATTKIAQALEISEEQAEKAKIICGLDPEKAQGIVKDILSETILSTSNRILEIIDFYQSSFPELPKISKLILSGGASNVKNLDKILSEKLGIETVQGDVFGNIDDKVSNYDESFSRSHNITLNLGKDGKEGATLTSKHNSSLGYATAIGLALRNFNG